MFDLGLPEILIVIIVAVLAIGPKDLPLALRTAGRWVGRARGMMRQVRSGFDSMVREAEMEELEKQWSEKNRRIMEEHGDSQMLPRYGLVDGADTDSGTATGASGEFTLPEDTGPDETRSGEAGPTGTVTQRMSAPGKDGVEET